MQSKRLSELTPVEPVAFDAGPLRELVSEVGVLAAELVTDAAIEELVSLLGAVASAWRASEFNRLGIGATQLCNVAGTIGMTTLAAVAGQIVTLSDGRDPVALAALVARLGRVGSASLHSLTDVAL